MWRNLLWRNRLIDFLSFSTPPRTRENAFMLLKAVSNLHIHGLQGGRDGAGWGRVGGLHLPLLGQLAKMTNDLSPLYLDPTFMLAVSLMMSSPADENNGLPGDGLTSLDWLATAAGEATTSFDGFFCFSCWPPSQQAILASLLLPSRPPMSWSLKLSNLMNWRSSTLKMVAVAVLDGLLGGKASK